MSDLPIERLQSTISHNGRRFLWPYELKGEENKRSRDKCYGVIFTCFVTRTVHLDLCVNYSTDAFLHTFRRLGSIRGWPKEMHSDNGSQLVAASKKLRDGVRNLNHGRIQRGGLDWWFKLEVLYR